MSTRVLTVLAMSAVSLGTVSVAPAFAINEIGALECNNPVWVDKYFIIGIRNNDGGFKRCFANAGERSLDQPGVTNFSSGNNKGWFEYEPGDGSRYRHSFGKNQSKYQRYGAVVKIHIDR
ncbi:beta/gamma crystallin domain-containing protein [Crossiella cryophila]|uniref:Streptomyces killer toxin-like beta/gamma crystallin domain-containing protein n=1 Tax=Crossiella cryophila TaxID=43355 RepID=A0A7W7CCG1_9PSEU|nr:beta/gamma crystallin domain-containing protein [Crossiella cryophila]MBB4678554.1 hypothetical protein [Crossiella cryophila]